MWAVVAAFTGASVLAALLIVLANTGTAERVSMNALVLHRTNSTLGTSALVRAAAGQASVFRDLVDDGVASPESLDAAEGELAAVTDNFVHLVDEADDQTALFASAFLEAVAQRPIDMSKVEATYAPLREELIDQVHTVEMAIGSNEDSAQRMSILLRVAVTLIIPIGVILLYRRRAASQVREAKAEMNVAMEAERTIVRAKNDFVAGLSHEMRTPLTGIYGFSELLLDSVDDESVREMVAEIHGQSAELARMVDDFIAMSRIDSDSMVFTSEPVQVDAVAQLVAARFERGDSKIETSGACCPALADEAKVTQILTNLVANAVQHGGGEVHVYSYEQDGSIVCEVIDNGPGVSEEVTDRVFKRFVNEGSEVLTNGSHGLGTWVASTLAERMDGSVVYSRRGDETVFSLRLPVAVDEDDHVSVPIDGLVSA
jgi:signal transduction histidine kinase